MKNLIPLFLSLISGYIFAQCDVQPNQLVTNCAFDSNFTGWTAPAGRGILSHNNAQGSNATGSLACVGQAAGAWTWCQPQQCIDVTPNTMYGAGFDSWLFSPPNVPGSYPPFVEVRYFEHSNNTCSMSVGGSGVATGSGMTVPMGGFGQTQGTLTSGASTESILMEIRMLNQGGNGPNDVFTGLFDDVFFGIGMTPVELQSMSVE